MVFSSLLFLYAFLPLNLLAYVLCRSLKAKNICLLIFSLVFYAWGEPKYVLLLMAMSFFDWLFALQIDRTDKKDKRTRKLWVVLACVVNLGLIGFFKYGKMFASVFGEPPAFIANISLPLGISFYTFQLLSYVIDVYRGEAPAQRKYWHVLLFAALYHQCIAGPIVRYKLIAAELFEGRDACPDMGRGVVRFSIGLAKKVILANACGLVADALILSETVLSDPTMVAANLAALSEASVLGLWVGLLVSAVQVYFDFSAYSDMAIGMGMMMGIHYPENFNYPYMAKSAGEYWRRWHITLGQWFRDYLYYPLTLGPALKLRKFFNKRWGRKSGLFMQSLFTMFVIWTCTGLWHGASWNFAVWGIYWFVFMFLEQNFLLRWLGKLPGFVSHVYLILLLVFSRIIFRFEGLHYMWPVVKGLFGLNGNAFSDFEVTTLLQNNMFILLFCVLAATPLLRNAVRWLEEKAAGSPVMSELFSMVRYAVFPVFLLLLSTAALVGSSYNPFLYYRF